MKVMSFIVEIVLIFLLSYVVFASVAAFTMMDLSLFNIASWEEIPRLMLVLIASVLFFMGKVSDDNRNINHY